MKKIKLLSITLLGALCALFVASCSSVSDSDSDSASITVGDETPLLSIDENIGNHIVCTINSSWLCENYVSIEASISIDGVDNAQDYYTRAEEATETQWGLQITSVDEETGTFNLYLESPTDNTYKYLPAVLKVLILDANGGETIAMRSIKFGDIVDTSVNISGIPLDEEAGETPTIIENTVVLPDFISILEKDESTGYYMININITGISDGESGYLDLKGTGDTGQNVWLEFDKAPKGILVEKVSSSTRAMNDIVFLVDNSGSMSEEANAIATSIQAWATELNDAGIDAQFGCVGYNGYIYGALDLTDVSGISDYLNRTTGTSRTVGFEDDEFLSSMASESTYRTTYGECGVVALRFANDLFSFRDGSNRIYVNFTDEPNQTNGDENNSVEYVNQASWSGKGTVHTVFSATSCNTSYNNNEDPRLMSTYTGGTSMDVDSSFTGVTLSSLPVSEAIQNSYIIRFTNIENYVGTGSAYDVMLVIKDGSVQSAKTISIEL